MGRHVGVGGHGQQPVSPLVASGGGAQQEAVQETVLDNGIQVLTEFMPGVRSAAVGVWVRQGSAHEVTGQGGISHMLEHMVFKGTRRRSARDLALSLEGLGGSLDAYTSREHTSYQARVLDEHLPVALDVLSDLVRDPLLRAEDLALEREVVLEEIAAVEDTPDDLVFELHGERLWRGHPYGRSILGDRETVASFRDEDLRSVHGTRYVGRNLVVAATGHVEHNDVLERVEGLFGMLPPGERTPAVQEVGPLEGGDERVERETTQAHVVFGAPAVPHPDPRRYALVLISTAFGGGMSSRLFQRVREELGLAYTVFTYHSFYARSGVAGVYVGTRSGSEEQVVDVIREEYARLAREGLPRDELEQVKQQVKGQIMLSLESTGGRLYRLAGAALHDEPHLGLDQVLERIEAITPAEIGETAARFFDPDRLVVLRLGPAPGTI